MRLRDERLSIGTALLGHRAASDASRLLPLCKALRPLRLNLRIADYRDRKMGLRMGQLCHAPIESSDPVTGKQQRGLIQKP